MSGPAVRATSAGFTLIEVLIALLVLAVGLLGFAMLQTMNVRFTESANYRTQVTQLSGALFDQVRADRGNLSSYAGTYTASVTASDCVPTTGAVSVSAFKTQWQCLLGRALGSGATATATATTSTGSGTLLTVVISWNDDRWNKNSAGNQTFTTSTRL